jgi:ParB family chromosome partitioning protein
VPKRGLPETVRMRHDEHYVEALTSSAGTPIGRMVPIDQLDPNPNQPRQVMGDLSELMASIAEKGIIEPIIVRQRGPRFQIVAGERRYQAAVQVGLREIPIVIREVDDNEIIEIALVENIQRKDLTPFEEAEGFTVAGHALRLHPRGHGAAVGEVSDRDYRVPFAQQHARRGQKPLSAGRHSL